MEEDKAEGEKEKAIRTARLMVADGESIEKISRYTGLSADEINSLLPG